VRGWRGTLLALVTFVTLLGDAVAHARPRHHARHHGVRSGAGRHHAVRPRTVRAHAPRVAALHPVARARLAAALHDLDRHGIRVHMTTAYRSHAEQRGLFRCAHQHACRARRGIYAAARPGRSLHEAGLAVDLAGVAKRGRRRRLTPQGTQIVRIMRRHGFEWRYGLRDPAHFEIAPRTAGYRTRRAAIAAGIVHPGLAVSHGVARRHRAAARA